MAKELERIKQEVRASKSYAQGVFLDVYLLNQTRLWWEVRSDVGLLASFFLITFTMAVDTNAKTRVINNPKNHLLKS